VGVLVPLIIYTAGVWLATKGQPLIAPIGGGQFYLASLGVMTVTLRKLFDAPLGTLEPKPPKVTILLGAHIGALLFAVAIWIVLTIQSLKRESTFATELTAWTGVVFVLLAAQAGWAVIRLSHRLPKA